MLGHSGGVETDHPVDPAGASRRTRVGVLENLHGVEVAPVGRGQADRVHGAEGAALPHRSERRELGVEPEVCVGPTRTGVGYVAGPTKLVDELTVASITGAHAGKTV